MPNREVNLTKRINTRVDRYRPVVLSAIGRVKPDVVLLNGKEEQHAEGAYYLEWREGIKRVRPVRLATTHRMQPRNDCEKKPS